MNQIHIAFIVLFVQLVTLYRNEVSLSNSDIVPALLSSFIGYFLFDLWNADYFKDESLLISNLIYFPLKNGAACLIGWVAALWVTEA